LGPGDTLGIGLAALISGCERYYGFDVVEYSNVERNLEIFEDLVLLFRERTDIPGQDEFPRLKPKLGTYRFPKHIFDENRLNVALESGRLQRIKTSIANMNHHDSWIKYKVPWCNTDVIENESVDMIISQAVLAHIDDLPSAYAGMYAWLSRQGYMSHQIDLSSHGTADEWNGHWAYSDYVWKIIRGRRPYLLNRVPHSGHLDLLEKSGFQVVVDKAAISKSNLTRQDLAKEFKSITDEDLITSGSFIQAVKKA
jgi:hypothetical protein